MRKSILNISCKQLGSEYYPAFDFLRIVLASVVALNHSGALIWNLSGDFSVQVFFAMSGWLIGGILLRSSPSDLPRFYFNRAARIWIPYFVAIALLMLASILSELITAKWVEIFFYDVTFTYNFFGVPQLAQFKNAMPSQGTGNLFWSICAEEQFYLFAPFLITIPALIGRSVWFWCVFTAMVFVSPYSVYFAAISLGVLAAAARIKLGDWQSKKSAIFTLAVVALVSFLAIYFEFVPYLIGAPLSAVSIVLLFAQAGSPTRISLFLGGISYPMYLNHWIGAIIARGIFSSFGPPVTFYSEIAAVGFAFVVASMLFLGIDRIVKSKRDHFFTASRGKTVAVSGFSLLAIGVVGGLILMFRSGYPPAIILR